MDEPHLSVANAVVALCGVAYFTAWSLSFYPQIILNFRRKTTVGLSPDFVYINPIGFLALTLWNWGVYFSPLARAQYAARHNGHAPQIAVADLAFSMHALVISIITLLQVFYYAHRARSDAKGHAVDERTRLIPLPGQVEQHTAFTKASTENPLRPSKLCQVIITGIVMASIISGAFVWADKAQWLDWLYFASSVKLFVSAIKYIPQIHLNWRLKSVEGFSIGNIIMDLTGSIFSFTQLAVSSIFIENDPSGIIANPAKLGMALLSLSYDVVFIWQNYCFKRRKKLDIS